MIVVVIVLGLGSEGEGTDSVSDAELQQLQQLPEEVYRKLGAHVFDSLNPIDDDDDDDDDWV